MEYDSKFLASLAAAEESMGPRGGDPLEKGYYIMAISAEDSSVDEVNGFPVLKPVAKVVLGEKVDRICYGQTVWWYGKEDSDSEKSFEDRTAITRRIARQKHLTPYIYNMLGNPGAGEAVAKSVAEAIECMNDDDPEQVSEGMSMLLEVLDGHNFVAYVSHRKNRDDASVVYAEFRPWVYTGGRKDPTIETLLTTWEEGLAKAGQTIEEVEI